MACMCAGVSAQEAKPAAYSKRRAASDAAMRRQARVREHMNGGAMPLMSQKDGGAAT